MAELWDQEMKTWFDGLTLQEQTAVRRTCHRCDCHALYEEGLILNCHCGYSGDYINNKIGHYMLAKHPNADLSHSTCG